MAEPDPFQDTRQLLTSLMAAISDRDYDAQAGLLHADLLLETPFAPPGAPRAVRSRSEYVDAMRGADRAFTHKRMVIDECFPLEGADALVARYHAEAETRTGRPFPQEYIGLFWFEGGKVARWQEYYNPAVIQKAFAPGDGS